MRKYNKNKKNGKNKNRRVNGGSYSLTGTSVYTTSQRPSFTFLDPHMYTTLRYCSFVTNSIATTLGVNNVFRLNSIFDPDAAVGGTQPYGYDQLAALYNRYRALKTRWKVTFSASTAGYNAVVVPTNGALNTPPADATSFASSSMVPYAKFFVYALGAKPPVTSGAIDLNVLGGVTKLEYETDDRFEAQIGANPAEVISLNIGLQNPSGGTISVSYFVELWYFVDLHDPISLAPS
jgi:hypothetical protein